MSEYKVGAYDTDMNYIMNMMRYMNMCDGLAVHVTVFTSIEEIRAYAKTYEIDALLLGENIAYETTDLLVIRLSENINSNIELGKIYKYKSASKIAMDICSYIKKHSSIKMKEGVYAVYSPVGRCGKSTLSMLLARKLQNTLLVKLEDFSISYERESIDERFMYYLISHNLEIQKMIELLPCTDNENNIKVVNGVRTFWDAREIKREDIEWLKQGDLSRLNIHNFVFDMGCAVISSLDVLKAFDSIYVPCIDDKNARSKLETFKKIIEKEEGMKGKMHYISSENFGEMNFVLQSFC